MNKKPVLRFNGYTDDWEQRKLISEIDKVLDYRGKSPTKFGMNWGSTGYLVLSALNVKDGYIDKTIDAKYGDQALFERWMGSEKLEEGDVIFTTEAPLGNVAQVPDGDGYILNQRAVGFKTNPESLNNNFLAQLLRSPLFQTKLQANSSGGTAKGIGMKEFAKLDVMIPLEIIEQKKIGNFFNLIDDTIALHQRELKLYETLKKTMLANLFPGQNKVKPTIRFKGFTDDWEQHKLINIGEFLSNGVDKIVRSDDKPVFMLNYMDVYKAISLDANNYSDLMKVTATETQIEKNSVRRGDVFFTPSSETPEDIGHSIAIDGDFDDLVYSYHLMRYRPEQGILDTSFSNYIFNHITFRRQLIFQSQGAQRYVVNRSGFEKLVVSLPELQEQAKLGQFFKVVDKRITLHQRELDYLKNQKVYFLKMMFV